MSHDPQVTRHESQPMAHQEPILAENNMFKTEKENENENLKNKKETLKIMYKTKRGYENAANHFMGLEHSYPDKESAIKVYTFLKKDSPQCIFIILSNKGRYL